MAITADDLRRFAPLAALHPDRAADLAALAHSHNYAAGATVLDFEDDSHDVFLIVEGGVRVVLRTASGHELIFGDFGPGDSFGEIAAIDGRARSASVTALYRSRMIVLPPGPMMATILASPDAALAMMRALTARLREKDERLLEMTALPVRLRLCAELLRLARTRGEAPGRAISPPPPHHELAARIGTRREVVSREISELARAGWVEADRQAIRLPQAEKMQAAVRAGLGGRRDD